MNQINVEKLAATVMKEMKDFSDLETKTAKKVITSAARYGAKEIRDTAPRKTGKYAKSWTSKKVEEKSNSVSFIIHSKDRYWLAHLPENGHPGKIRKRSIGFVKAIPHIAPAEKKVIEYLEKRLGREL